MQCFGLCHIWELWTVFVAMKRMFFFLLFAQIFFSADHIPVCSFTAFFLFMLQLHATSHNQQLCVCVCNQYMTSWFNWLVLESDQRKASYQSSFTHAQQINPYNKFNTFLSAWVKIRIIISGCHAAKINNFSTKQFATNRQHISSRENKLVTIPACEGHPRSLVCSFPFFCDWRWRAESSLRGSTSPSPWLVNGQTVEKLWFRLTRWPLTQLTGSTSTCSGRAPGWAPGRAEAGSGMLRLPPGTLWEEEEGCVKENWAPDALDGKTDERLSNVVFFFLLRLPWWLGWAVTHLQAKPKTRTDSNGLTNDKGEQQIFLHTHERGISACVMKELL